jgi:hypothetical protein
MNSDKNYLSEFEQEFEFDDMSSEYSDESDMSGEFENDFSNESDDESEFESEYELSDEYELDDESESDDEYELESEYEDSESKNYLQEYGSPDQEFEDRIYSALNGQYESSFEMEQEIDRVLHEMEVEYFWKSAKKFWNKHKKRIMPFAKHLIPGGTLASLAKYAGADVRGLLKKGITMAGNAYLPGVGGALAGSLAGKFLNRETPNVNDARAQASEVVGVAKDAFKNMAMLVPNLRRGNIPNQISRFSRQAVGMAKKRRSGNRGKAKRVIRRNPGSTVVVKSDRIIIYS